MVHSADRPAGGARPEVSGSPAPSVTPAELDAMERALELARRGPVHGPNPRVGCVLLSSAGALLAEGWHDGAGTPHAEAAAVAAARAQDIDLWGATAVVTLEPCNHTGRTPPCTELLLAIPFASNSSVQGGVRPVWLHGSSLTTAVAHIRSMPCARAAATAA